MADETISFRRSLTPWQRFTIETRIVGYDAKAVYVEQRAVVKGEIYARATTRGRFVKKRGGTVTTAEVAELTGIDITGHPLPEWVARWATDVALPAARAAAPSRWE